MAAPLVHDGASRRSSPPPHRSRPNEVRQRSYRELLSATLAAIRDNDTDTEMELRAEIMGRFRRSDVQINPALFRLLTAQESGGGEVGYGGDGALGGSGSGA